MTDLVNDLKLSLQAALVPPRLNLNGTSKQELLTQYRNALHALYAADMALAGMSPHSRDYQTLPDGQFDIAAKQHRARQGMLSGVMLEVSVLVAEFVTANQK